jgi:histidinol-phosphate/aromatic aminotransferase/cobyric acid decarboxylase-like protein/choline kinase
MKAVILAAGYGNRMRPLTDNVHKTLLQVGGKTILDRIVEGLRRAAILDIVVVTGYRKEDVEEHLLQRHADLRFRFVHNPRYRETNNIYSLSLALNTIDIDDDILLIESDLVYDDSVIGRILASPYPNVALLDRYRSGMDGTLVTVSDGVITSIIPPHLQHENFDYRGKFKTLNIYKFSREFCNQNFRRLLTYYAKVIDDNCYYEMILGILIYVQKEVIYAEILEGEEWSEVDDPNDLRVCEFVFNKEKRLPILESTFGGYWAHDIVDFCFIRNMYFPTPSMLSELKNNLINLVQNYGSRQDVLDEKLAYFLLCRRERVHLLNGVSQMYPILKSLHADKRALIPAPTFGEYRRLEKYTPYSDQVGIDPREIEERAESCELVVFVNPNNPTGTLLDSEWIHQFAARHSGKTVLVDESFIDFAGSPSVFELLEKTPLSNVIVIKSLSKVLGVPGLRLGFSYSHDPVFNQKVRESLPIWNSNSLAECFLEILLKHRQALAESFQKTRKDRDEFADRLAKEPFVRRVHESAANFILVELAGSVKPRELASWLLSTRGVYVKDVSDRFADEKSYLRLAVRLPEENNRLLEYLELYFKKEVSYSTPGKKRQFG